MGSSRDVLVWIGFIACLSSPCAAQTTQDRPGTATVGDAKHERASFDIQAQPLVTALRAYSEITGLAVLVDDALAAGRRSPGVRGNLAAPEALDRLLDGTGLVAHYASERAFTVVPAANDAAAAPASSAAEAPAEEAPAAMERYAGQIQRAIERALCRNEDTRPGSYRLAMQLWIDGAGTVARTSLLGSTGTSARDAEVASLLDGLHLEPQAGTLPQPLTILLQQKPPGQLFDCGAVQ